MKIAVVIESYQPFGGGNERSTEQIVERLSQRHHAVTVLTHRASAESTGGGAEVVCAGGPKTSGACGLWRFARWARRRLDEGGFDVSLSVTAAVAADVVQPRGGTVRETLSRNIAMRPTTAGRIAKEAAIAVNPKQLALLAAEWRTLNSHRVKRLVAISRYVADQLFRHYTIPSRRIAFIPNAAAIRQVEPAERAERRRRTRQTLMLDEGDVAMLFAATNPRLKGLGPALEAMGALKRQNKPAKLIVAGTMSYAFQRRASELGVRDMLRWVGPTRRIDSLYIAADVLVHPTYYDPSSKVVLEALLHGVPAISTAYNGASQWIADPTGRTPWSSPLVQANPAEQATPARPAGRVVRSPDDGPALAQAMIELCDADERARCAAATGQLDQALHMDRHVEALEKVLSEVAAGR